MASLVDAWLQGSTTLWIAGYPDKRLPVYPFELVKNRRGNGRYLAAPDPDNARALMTVTGGRTVFELRGISCLPLELTEPTRKGIAVTRSFGAPVTSWQEMREAIASYAT
ncbi:hypothetical protein [Granulicella arctica]|uniref:hypothetical protein n=1 Tax=Granulicella arctica TaxID=940613 RepID=UPI0021DF78C8|nr:hypothetical protein [Granulicella arctica]